MALLGYVHPCHKPQYHPDHKQQTPTGLVLFYDGLGVDYIVFSDEAAILNVMVLSIIFISIAFSSFYIN